MDGRRRTVVVHALENGEESYSQALRRVATMREQTPEPAASALYLILIGKAGLAEQEARAMESDERFCRKHVWRWDEPVHDFLDRTFLGLSAIRMTAVRGEQGPRARILARPEARFERAAQLLDALADLPDDETETAAWLSRRLAKATT